MLISGTERRKINRPWWRWPLRVMLRIRPRRRNMHGSIAHRLLGSRLLEPHLWIPDKDSAARGAAIGLFFGMLPLPGLQFIPSALTCVFTRSNIATALLGTFTSNPLTVGGLLWMQVKLGQWMVPALAEVNSEQYNGASKYFALYGKPLLLGSLTFAVLGGLTAYLTVLGIWRLAEAAVKRRKLHKKSG